jgi:hypothetical protein
MIIVVPDVGKIGLLNQLTEGDGFNLRLRLYKNNIVPDQGTVLASFIECDFGGYVYQNGVWQTPAVLVANHRSYSAWGHTTPATPFTFTCSANVNLPQTAYGFFVTSPTGYSAEVLFAAVFDTPQPVVAIGNTVIVTPSMLMCQC